MVGKDSIENQELLDLLIDRYWMNGKIAKNDGFIPIEVIVTGECNQSCAYCYYTNHINEIYPKSLCDFNILKENFIKVLSWIDKMEKPVCLDLFSGEFFVQKIGYEILDILLNGDHNIKAVMIPTNFSFCNDNEMMLNIEKYIEKFNDKGIALNFSASFDGLYGDKYRPWSKQLDIKVNCEYNDSFYNNVFSFCKKHNIGFHPMLYSKSISNWKENFLWFQEKFSEYNINWWNLYLLEVRNDNWSNKDCFDLYCFMRFLVKWYCKKIETEGLDFEKYFFDMSKNFNILLSPFMNIRRGIGCTLQTHLHLRLGDLKFFPCHRLAYKDFELGNLRNGSVLENNITLWSGILSYEQKNAPLCVTCPLKELCSGGCLGAQYETTYDLFAPIPSVCHMEWYKIKGIIDELEEQNKLDIIFKTLSREKIIAIKQILSIKIKEIE